MKVYHGSNVAIKEVNFDLCVAGKDFGKGFYVTKILSQAEYWATRKGKMKKSGGVVTEFEYDERISRLMKMKTLYFDGYTDEWLNFVVLNRRNTSEQQAHVYDIIEGPIADDDIARRIVNYLNDEISREEFLGDLIYEPSHQICFCTVQSLQALEAPNFKVDSKIMNIDNEIVKTLMIDYGLTEVEAADIHYTSATYTQLADEATGFYLKPWQEILQMLQKELKL
jgi:hypothetical protein